MSKSDYIIFRITPEDKRMLETYRIRTGNYYMTDMIKRSLESYIYDKTGESIKLK